MDTLKQYKHGDLYAKHAITHAPHDGAFPMHIHDTFEIYFFVSGKVDYLVEGASYSLHAGDLLLIRPTEAHKPKILQSTKYERYNINFPSSLIQSIDCEERLLRPFWERPLGQENLYTAAEFEGLQIEKMFHDICYCEEDAYSNQLKITIFLIKLLEAINIAFERKSKSDYIPNNREGKIVTFVNAHITENISVPQLAKHFYLSPSQFNRIFKNATGTTPWNYITVKRLTAAKESLQCGMSAHDVALLCGFNDYSVFYRAYIKHFGHAPTDK